jgi:purine-binding chemotaxis protein CheW
MNKSDTTEHPINVQDDLDTKESEQKTVSPKIKFLTFILADERYGLEILKVIEIIGMLPITRVPHSPKYIKGVINLRGRVITVADLRCRFGLESAEFTHETCIIVVQANSLTMGIIVDQVADVVDIEEANIEETPSFGSSISAEYVAAIGKAQDRVILLLDIDRVLSYSELDRNATDQLTSVSVMENCMVC